MILMGVGLKQWLGESAPAVVCGVYVGIGVALAVGSRGFLVRSTTESD